MHLESLLEEDKRNRAMANGFYAVGLGNVRAEMTNLLGTIATEPVVSLRTKSKRETKKRQSFVSQWTARRGAILDRTKTLRAAAADKDDEQELMSSPWD